MVCCGVLVEQGKTTGMSLDELLCSFVECAIWMFIYQRRLSDPELLLDI